jgi:hypothetical protein
MNEVQNESSPSLSSRHTRVSRHPLHNNLNSLPPLPVVLHYTCIARSNSTPTLPVLAEVIVHQYYNIELTPLKTEAFFCYTQHRVSNFPAFLPFLFTVVFKTWPPPF